MCGRGGRADRSPSDVTIAANSGGAWDNELFTFQPIPKMCRPSAKASTSTPANLRPEAKTSLGQCKPRRSFRRPWRTGFDNCQGRCQRDHRKPAALDAELCRIQQQAEGQAPRSGPPAVRPSPRPADCSSAMTSAGSVPFPSSASCRARSFVEPSVRWYSTLETNVSVRSRWSSRSFMQG